MNEEEIEVVAYAGYRGEESPKMIFLHNRKIEILQILERYTEEFQNDRSRRNFFHVKGSDQKTYTICYHEEKQKWYRRNNPD